LGANVNNIDSEGITPLMWAAKRDHAEISIILVKSNADFRRRSKEGRFIAYDKLRFECFGL
jgi:ankyrin repeat protein